MLLPRLSSVPALLVVAVLALAGCGGEDEGRADARPSTDVPETCGYLDESTRTRLAGTKVGVGVDPSERRTAGLACVWTDSKLADATTQLYLGGTDSQTWARDLEQILAGEFIDSERQDEFRDLTDTKEARARLTADQACRLWTKVATAYDTAPKGGIVLATAKPAPENGERHVARAELCRDGVFAQLSVRSTKPISAERVDLVRTEVLTVWQQLKKRQDAGGKLS